jgi:hypothetical protein
MMASTIDGCQNIEDVELTIIQAGRTGRIDADTVTAAHAIIRAAGESAQEPESRRARLQRLSASQARRVDEKTGTDLHVEIINPIGVEKPSTTTSTTNTVVVRGVSKLLLAAVAFIAIVAVCGCAIAVLALAKAENAITQATGDVTLQVFIAQRARTEYEAGAQRIIGHATTNLGMHPACGQSEANREVRTS